MPLLLLKTNKDYPIFDMLLQNNYKHFIKNEDNFETLLNSTLKFKKFDIDAYEDKNILLENLLKLGRTEKHYLKNIDNTDKLLPNISLVLQILIDAKSSIEKLKSINKSNKKIAYYESGKNANLDDLVKHFSKKLALRGEDELSLESSKKEFKLKRFIARLKKDNPLFINYYLALFKIIDLRNINVSKEDEKLLNGISKLLDFFTLGHATDAKIYKSVAIQIYFIYKDKFTHSELTTIIGYIIDIMFETEKPYQNFSSFNQDKVYIKNRIDNFILFDLDDSLQFKQSEQFNEFFEESIMTESIFYQTSFIKIISKKLINNPLFFVLSMEQTKTFGYSPIKK